MGFPLSGPSGAHPTPKPIVTPKRPNVYHFKHSFTLGKGIKVLTVGRLESGHAEERGLFKARDVVDAKSGKPIGYAVSTEPSVVTLYNLAGQSVLEIEGLPRGFETLEYEDKTGRKVKLSANPASWKVDDPFNKGKTLYRAEFKSGNKNEITKMFKVFK